MTLVPASGTDQRFVAVIGGGVSGLTAAYVLARSGHHVTLYEADDRLGGHAHTHEVTGPDGRVHGVDSGFIVYNERTYPLLTRLLAELDVPGQDSEMGMSVRCEGCGLQYAAHRGPRGLLPGLTRGRARYTKLLTEVPAFHLRARELLDAGGQDDDMTLGQFLAEGDFSAYFRSHFALPLVAAVWSCPPGTARHYPARYLFEFLRNHGMLSVHGSPTWKTVTGGSQRYVREIARRWRPCRPRPRPAPCTDSRTGPPSATVTAGPPRSTTWSSPLTPTRPSACWPTPPRSRRRCWARFRTPPTQPCCTPTAGCCRAVPGSAPPGTTSSATATARTSGPGSATT